MSIPLVQTLNMKSLQGLDLSRWRVRYFCIVQSRSIASSACPLPSAKEVRCHARCLHPCLHLRQTCELKYFDFRPNFRVFPPPSLFPAPHTRALFSSHSTLFQTTRTLYSSHFQFVYASTLQAPCLRQQLPPPHRPPRSLALALLRSLSHHLLAPMATALVATSVNVSRLLVASIMVRVPRFFSVALF